MDGLKFKKNRPGDYDVYFSDVRLGSVWRDPDAWSYASWFIDGVPQRIACGGVNGFDRKPSGFGTRMQAARHLAMMKSGAVLQAS